MNDSFLNSKKWCDLVFEGKNKSYGAYSVRLDSSKRHLKSLLIVIVATASLSLIPSLVKTEMLHKNVFGNYVDPIILKKLEVNLNPVEPQLPEPIFEEPIPELNSSQRFVPPVIVADNEVREIDIMATQIELSESNLPISIATVKGKDDGSGIDIADVEKGITTGGGEGEGKNEILSFVESMPQFPGGNGELMSYLGKSIKFPIISIENGIQGTVLLKFVVEKDGSIDNIEIIRSLDSGCDKEAVRVLKSMPKWIAGKQNGVPVRVYFTLPVKFKLT